MPLWKQTLLAAYYTATLPARRRASARRAAEGRAPITVLFYHRVADRPRNGWTMPRAAFRRQIDWLARRFEVISLADAQRRVASGWNDCPAVCLTFDDGYADNCEYALPLLLRKGLPFTYFVSTNHVLRGDFFPHDLDAGAPLRPNSRAEVKALASAGVEIGAHTRSHADLRRAPHEQAVRDEIVGAKEELEQAIERPVRYFAFPFGLHANLTQAAFRVAHRAGFAGVCSAYGGYNWPGDDAFHVRRAHADPELIRVKNWLSVDPRKTRVADFDPGDYAADSVPAPAPAEARH